MAARSCTPSSVRSALIVPRTHEVIDRLVVVCGNSTYIREPVGRDLGVTAKSAGAQTPIRQPAARWRVSCRWVQKVPADQRGGAVGGEPEFACDGSHFGRRRGCAGSAKPSSCCTRRACVDGRAASRDMIRAGQYRRAPQYLARRPRPGVAEPCCTQMVPANTGASARTGRRLINADRQSRAQTQLRAFGDANHVARRRAAHRRCPIGQIHFRCSGGPARPRMDRRRSSSASSLEAE